MCYIQAHIANAEELIIDEEPREETKAHLHLNQAIDLNIYEIFK